jgi:hypothetical protein
MQAKAVGTLRKIVGFHQDEFLDWVDDLECGHRQHVRHNPRWTTRLGDALRAYQFFDSTTFSASCPTLDALRSFSAARFPPQADTADAFR